MDEDNIITLNDENGNEVEFEFLDLIPYRQNEYVVLLPIGDSDGQVVILQLKEIDDETEEYVGVENEFVLETVFTIRVVLICHLRFPPFSNSILNFVLPSSDTSIKTVASKVLPVLSDLQFLSFTLPEPSNFCAVAEVMLLPMLAK